MELMVSSLTYSNCTLAPGVNYCMRKEKAIEPIGYSYPGFGFGESYPILLEVGGFSIPYKVGR